MCSDCVRSRRGWQYVKGLAAASVGPTYLEAEREGGRVEVLSQHHCLRPVGQPAVELGADGDRRGGGGDAHTVHSTDPQGVRGVAVESNVPEGVVYGRERGGGGL